MGRTEYSKIVGWQYRLTRTDAGLKIEVLDYHAEPVVLTPEVLEEFGLFFGKPSAGKKAPSKRRGRTPAKPAERVD